MMFLRAAVFFGALSSALGSVTSYEVAPRDTDQGIGTAFSSPHSIYVERKIVLAAGPQSSRDRHELLLFLPGTGGNADGAKAFCELAAELGYHVINLMYPDDIPASVCAGDSNPRAFEEFRLAIIAGGRSKHITIAPADCIENRLAKLLLHLGGKRSEENWAQFLNEDGTIKWQVIAVAGQSQGGGHAALIGIKHRVARVICTGAPKDYSRRLDAPAAWYSEVSATPKACFFTFNHRQDARACTPEQLRRNLAALKLDEFGPPVDAATEDSPYHHTRILTTSYPVVTIEGPNSQGARIAHTSVIATANAARWQKVWTYMLTEKVP
jgi:hypothetical protein